MAKLDAVQKTKTNPPNSAVDNPWSSFWAGQGEGGADFRPYLAEFIFNLTRSAPRHGSADFSIFFRTWSHTGSICCIFRRFEKTCFSDRPKSPLKRSKVAQGPPNARHASKHTRIFGSWVPWLAHARVKDKLVQWTRIRGKNGKLERPDSQKESLRDLTRLWARGLALHIVARLRRA